jgi:hypothetical protein
MTEDFLHYFWRYKSAGREFRLASGEKLEVVRPGIHNSDSGPDFMHARLRIDGTLWAGNVEIHVLSSDWIRHGHPGDANYDNIILHVVYSDDAIIRRSSGSAMPTLELFSYIPPEVFDSYCQFLASHLWVPCAMHLKDIPAIKAESWLETLAATRLERKCREISGILEETHYDWNQAFFISLAATLGFRINKQPFEMLARQTPLTCIEKHRNDPMQVEAILFGQAGMLEGRFRPGEYPAVLQREYRHLSRKFSLKPIPGHLWKFMRLRPNNFPTIRLAQLASILCRNPLIFGEILDRKNDDDLSRVFNAGVSDYWQRHYRFGEASPRSFSKSLSPDTLNLILINNVIPFLFQYGETRNEPGLKELALRLLEGLPPESNSIIRKFKEFGLEPHSALQSQGMLELKTAWCDERKCLDCSFGIEWIS